MTSATAGSIPGNPFQEVFGPIGGWLKKALFTLIVGLLWAAVFAFVVGAGVFLFYQFRSGNVESTVEHVNVAGQETVGNPLKLAIKQNAPGLYYTFVEPESLQPYAIDSVVQNNKNNEELGVKIVEFEPQVSFFRPNSEISLRGRIKARGLDQPTKIEVYCQLEEEQMIPAELLGTNVIGLNIGTIFKDQTTEFRVNCNFPDGVSTTKAIESRTAKLVVIYEFSTVSSQRIWALNRESLQDLQSKGIDPFVQYDKRDPLKDKDNKIRAEQTPGPINLGLQIDFPQPITTNSRYELLVQIAPQSYGVLQELNYLKIKVPAVKDLNLALQGGEALGSGSKCDFTYAGQTDDGYKEYQLVDSKLQETNKVCDKELLREYAFTEQACLEFFKQPLFKCNFIATTVPETLLSDLIKAEALYSVKVEKKLVIDIKGPPSSAAGVA
ncbi:MAG TPA: hypothetical protein VJI68_00200 [Candidatus Nanoarchaeia archaeon]|nr:hypothetical protein [Candidatus Nanoarchaeia archaeon]